MKDAKYSYKNLEAYKESKTLVKQVYALLKKFPKEETYALCDQLRRAVISVPSNIAEGSGRTSAKDQAHFFEMAFGSLIEVDCQVDIAHDFLLQSRRSIALQPSEIILSDTTSWSMSRMVATELNMAISCL